MQKILVLCRRAVDWSSVRQGQFRDSHFVLRHKTKNLVADWNRQNPHCQFYDYRAFLHDLARKSWEATGAGVVLNHLEPDFDASMDDELIEKLGSADWIVPIDDDDWLSPDLASRLSEIDPRKQGVVTWPSMIVHIDGPHVFAEETRTYLASDNQTIISCSYAISGAILPDIGAEQAKAILIAHDQARYAMIWFGARKLDQPMALHLRHGAAASQGPVDRRLHPLGRQFAWPEQGAWAAPYMDDLAEFHCTHASLQS